MKRKFGGTNYSGSEQHGGSFGGTYSGSEQHGGSFGGTYSGSPEQHGGSFGGTYIGSFEHSGSPYSGTYIGSFEHSGSGGPYSGTSHSGSLEHSGSPYSGTYSGSPEQHGGSFGGTYSGSPEQYGGSIKHSGSQYGGSQNYEYEYRDFPNVENFTSDFSFEGKKYFEAGGSFHVDTKMTFGQHKIEYLMPSSHSSVNQVLFCIEFIIAVRESDLERLKKLLKSEKNLFKNPERLSFDNYNSDISFMSYLLKCGKLKFIHDLTKGSNPILTKECFSDENLSCKITTIKHYQNIKFLLEETDFIPEKTFVKNLDETSKGWLRSDRRITKTNTNVQRLEDKTEILKATNDHLRNENKLLKERLKDMERLTEKVMQKVDIKPRKKKTFNK